MAYVYAILSLGLLGTLFGVVLAIAAKKFAVETDPREEKILALLPGANCGACGFPGCSAVAGAIVSGRIAPYACPICSAMAANQIADLMGAAHVEESEKKIARVMCGGASDKAGKRFEYDGLADCRAAALVGGGYKACSYGCLGLGTCARACPFDAIEMAGNGLPVVDEEACTGCGKCVGVCPKGIIELVPESKKVDVLCRSRAKPAEVRKACKVGCIGCGICVKQCPQEAIILENNLARIIAEKCDACGKCVEKCPTKCIVMVDRVCQVDSEGKLAS